MGLRAFREPRQYRSITLISLGKQLICQSPSAQRPFAKREQQPCAEGGMWCLSPGIIRMVSFPRGAQSILAQQQASPVLCFLTIICLNNSSIGLCWKRYSPGHTFLHPLGKTKSLMFCLYLECNPESFCCNHYLFVLCI